ncbi:hypothetical protein DGN16_22635 [Xanthomonas citri pv. fuscans]|nr:hypothetical protein DGN16_22635 [Xanthomonas citri pv. fuscans]
MGPRHANCRSNSNTILKAAKQQSSKAAKQQSSKAAKQQSSKAAKQQSSKAAKQQSSRLGCANGDGVMMVAIGRCGKSGWYRCSNDGSFCGTRATFTQPGPRHLFL